jgi:hypothetical protein
MGPRGNSVRPGGFSSSGCAIMTGYLKAESEG